MIQLVYITVVLEDSYGVVSVVYHTIDALSGRPAARISLPENIKISKGIYVNYTIYVTGFGKTCIVHTSNFSTLATHKISYE